MGTKSIKSDNVGKHNNLTKKLNIIIDIVKFQKIMFWLVIILLIFPVVTALENPEENFRNSYRIVAPIKGNWYHFINIAVPKDAIKSVKIDGKPVAPDLFKPCSNSKYMIAQIQIKLGVHLVECHKPFGISNYGLGSDKDAFDAYGNM